MATDNPHLTGWFTRRRMDADATRAGKCRPHASVLPTESELRNECPVPLDVVAPEVIQQPTTTTHEHQQATTAVMVLLVELQMLRQVVDAPREERNLHLRRTGIGSVEAMLSDRCSGIGHAKTKILRVAEAARVARTRHGRLVGAVRPSGTNARGLSCRVPYGFMGLGRVSHPRVTMRRYVRLDRIRRSRRCWRRG